MPSHPLIMRVQKRVYWSGQADVMFRYVHREATATEQNSAVVVIHLLKCKIILDFFLR